MDAGALCHTFRLKKRKHKSLRKKAYYGKYITGCRLGFILHYEMFYDIILMKNWLIRTLDSQGYVHKVSSPGPSIPSPPPTPLPLQGGRAEMKEQSAHPDGNTLKTAQLKQISAKKQSIKRIGHSAN